MSTPLTTEYTHTNHSVNDRSVSRSPTRSAQRNSPRSNPNDIPTRRSSKPTPYFPPPPRTQQRSFKDLVNRFNQPTDPATQAALQAYNQDRSRRPTEQRPTKLTKPRSPTKASPARSQARKAHVGARTAQGGTDTSTTGQSHGLVESNGVHDFPTSPAKRQRKPLFGEVVFEQGTAFSAGYGVPAYRYRRGSEGSINGLPTTRLQARSQSHAALSFTPNPGMQDLFAPQDRLGHQRSKSDLAASEYHRIDSGQRSMPPQVSQFTFTSSPQTSIPQRTFDPPVNARLHMADSAASLQSRNTPPTSRAKNHFPSPKRTSPGKENLLNRKQPSPLPILTSQRYDPTVRPAGQAAATLRAYISAAEPPQSPPLRSSRPRQSVAVATTSASRARVAERLANNDSAGAIEDAVRSRRKKIPELGRVDFAERRARIERAISQNVKEEERSERGASSARTSRSNSLFQTDSRADSSEQHINASHGQDTVGQTELPGTTQLHVDPPQLALDGGHVPQDISNEPLSAGTEFEIDESPINRHIDIPMVETSVLEDDDDQDLLTARPDRATFSESSDLPEAPQSLLSQVMRMRERSSSSHSGTDIAEGSISSASHLDDQESINIMLDGSSPVQGHDGWMGQESLDKRHDNLEGPAIWPVVDDDETTGPKTVAEKKDADRIEASPTEPETPRRLPSDSMEDPKDDTPRQQGTIRQPSIFTSISTDSGCNPDQYEAVRRIMDEYRQSGDLSPQMLHEFQSRVMTMSTDFSQDGGSDAASIKIFLDSMLSNPLRAGEHAPQRDEKPQYLAPVAYHKPKATIPQEQPELEHQVEEVQLYHDTPLSSKGEQFQTVDRGDDFLFDSSAAETPVESETETLPQFPRLRYEAPDTTGAAQMESDERPTPPPKDMGYSPRLSATYHTLEGRPPSPPSARLSKVSDYQLHLPDFQASEGFGQGLGLTLDAGSEPRSSVADSPPRSSMAESLPPAPHYAPPPVPSPNATQKHFVIDLMPSAPSTASPPAPTSPRTENHLYQATSGAVRPSVDSLQAGASTLPASKSMSSIDSTRLPSVDRSSPATVEEMNPDQKRLTKRRNIIKELVDTEYSYHQDMKIIEDIYKATVGDLITADDKKVLFGNSDQVEAFSLEFYDALRRAVAPFYIPPKSSRWLTKRSSFSTNTSGNDNDGPDEERDRKTVVGEVFERYMARMEKVYAGYLRNHDGANQSLTRLQGDATVKCWLAECHNNASDITSAWDLDSLLVKPVQRILKYPLLLQQLLETTTADHPDREALERAVKETMNVSHRINEAKKRADLVDQIVNRKRKDSDVRTGLAKAFGRRTEKLRERVGIAEAYQDPEFDELAHKFGGHFIRLQVCMRDVQGSVTETDKAVTQINAFATALEAYIDLGLNSFPEIESKWRKYAQAIRELTAVALTDHKARVKRRVIDPMVMAIKLHEGPQNAITKRKKRIVDYAKCKSIERKGEKLDKKTVEASELYEALNEQLKIDLPKLYTLTADLIQACLACHREIQMDWLWTWEMKLRPVLDEFPPSLASIAPAFFADFDIVHAQVLSLALCNGTMLADAANFLSPQTTLIGDDASSQRRRTDPPSSRTVSVGSQHSPSLLMSPEQHRSYSGAFTLSPITTSDVPPMPNGHIMANGRVRSSSSLSQRGRAMSTQGNGPPPSSSRMPSATPKSSFSSSRPPTSHARPADLSCTPAYNRVEQGNSRSPRPGSGASYFTAHQDGANQRYSGLFSSAMPMSDLPGSSGPTSPKHAPEETRVLFVAASLFEFNIDRARREAGYPYLTYVQGEVRY